jgi:hypothetical protein
VSVSAKLKAVYSLYPPIRSDSEAAVSLYHRFFEDFTSTKTIPVRGSFVHNGELLAITSRPCTDNQRRRYFPKSPFLQVGDALLEFSATFEFPGQDRFFATDHTGKRIVRTAEQAIQDWKAFLPHDLELTIQSYFCALSIAYEGAVRPTGNIWMINGSRYRADRYYLSQIHDAIEFLRAKQAFPKIDLEIDKVIKWTFSQNGMCNGNSDTPASRALNYFTRPFVNAFRNDELSDLVWALAGIEALIVDSGRSSVGQLKEKLCALFSETMEATWLSKMIAETYHFRSRMIHGDRQIKSVFRADEDNSRFDEEYDSQLFAIDMLALLLRFVIAKDLSRINFRTILAP